MTTCWSSRSTISSSAVARLIVRRQLVAQRDEAAAVVVAGEVQDDRAQVGGRLALVLRGGGRCGRSG